MAVCKVERNNSGAISKVALDGNLNYTPGIVMRLTDSELGVLNEKLDGAITKDVKHKDVNGFISGDKVYINPDMIGQDTPMRNAGVLLAGVIKKIAPLYYAQIAYEVSKDQALLDKVRNVDTYNFLKTEQEIVDKAASMMLEQYIDELTDFSTMFNIAPNESIGDMTASEFIDAVANNGINQNIPEFSYSRGVFRNVVDQSGVTAGKVDDVVEMTTNITNNLARRLGLQVKEYIQKVKYRYTKKDINRAFLNEQIAILGFSAPGFFDESSEPITLNQPNKDYISAHERNPKIAKIGISPSRNPWAIRYLQGGKKGKQFQNAASAIELDKLISDELDDIYRRIEFTNDFYISEVNVERMQRELSDPNINPQRAQMIKYIMSNPSEYIKKLAEVQRKDLQQAYSAVFSSHVTPDALKLLMLESIISESYRSNPDKGGIVITKRNKYTESSFSPPVKAVLLLLSESDAWQSSNKIMEDYLYTLQDNSKKRVNLQDYAANIHSQTEDGIWYRFKQDNEDDAIKMNHLNVIAYDPSKWCTNSLETARTYLSRGDMFLFFDTNVYDSTIQIAPDSGGEGNGIIAGRGKGETLLDEDYKQIKSLLNTTPEIVEKVKPEYDYLKYKEAVDIFHKFGLKALSKEMLAIIAESEPSKVDRFPGRLIEAKEAVFLDKEILAKSIGVDTNSLIDILDDDFMNDFWDNKTNSFVLEGTKDKPLYLFSSEKHFGRMHVSRMKHVKLVNGYMTIAGFGNLSLEDVDLNSAKVDLGYGDITLDNVSGSAELYTNDAIKSITIKNSNLQGANVFLVNFEDNNYDVRISDSHIGDLTTPSITDISNLTVPLLQIQYTNASELDFRTIHSNRVSISDMSPNSKAVTIKNLNTKELDINPYVGTEITITDSNLVDLRSGFATVNKVTLRNVTITDSIHPDFGLDITIENSMIANMFPRRDCSLYVKGSKLGKLSIKGSPSMISSAIQNIITDTTIDDLDVRVNPILKLNNASIREMSVATAAAGTISVDNLTVVEDLFYRRAEGISDFSFVSKNIHFEDSNLPTLTLRSNVKVIIHNCDVNVNTFSNTNKLDTLFIRGYKGQLLLQDKEISLIRVAPSDTFEGTPFTMKNIKAKSTTITSPFGDITNITGSLFLMPSDDTAIYHVRDASSVSSMNGSLFISGKINYLNLSLSELTTLDLNNSEVELLSLDVSKLGVGTPIISKGNAILHSVILNFSDGVPGFIYDFFTSKGGIQKVNFLGLPYGDELVPFVSKLKSIGIEDINIHPDTESFPRFPKRFLEQLPDSVTYYQEERKAAIIRQKQNSLLIFGKQSDVTSIIHEKTHEFEQGLTFDERKTIEEWSGYKSGTIEFSEAFAKGAEKFIYDGIIEANAETISIFQKFADWFKSLIEDAINYFADINDLNDGIREIYTRMILRDSQVTTQELAPELQSVKDKTLLDGTYMKAPDGTLTKLSELEWLQTQTDAFKQMYGDTIKAYKVRAAIEYKDENDNRCSTAADGARGKFHPGNRWEIVKDLKGYPSHAQGGVDIKLGKNGFSFTRDNGVIEAKHGLVLPKIK